MRAEPGSRLLHTLPEGALVQILFQRVTADRTAWVEIRDLFGRTGWTVARYLAPQR